MPVLYERDDARRRVVETSVGDITLKELLTVLDRQIAEGAWSYTVLNDARAVVNVPTTEELHQFLLRIGALTCERGPRGRTALVVTDRTLEQIAARFSRLSELTAYDVKVFKTMDAADQWLESSSDVTA